MPTWNLVPQLVHDTPKQKSWKIYWVIDHPESDKISNVSGALIKIERQDPEYDQGYSLLIDRNLCLKIFQH